jgi:hypothetical protein
MKAVVKKALGWAAATAGKLIIDFAARRQLLYSHRHTV